MVSGIYGPDPEDADGTEEAAPEASSLADAEDAERIEVSEEALYVQRTRSGQPMEGGEEDPEPEAEQREDLFQNAWSVLYHWRRPPGTREDGTLDGEYLKE